MRLFIKKVLFFLLLPVLLFITVFFLLDFLSKQIIDHNCKEDIIYYLIAGDSHVRQTFNDKKINFSRNIAQNSESYYFTYYKLERILKAESQIKTVFLGLSYHNLSGYIDDFIFGKFSSSVSKNYFFILPLQEKLNLFSANKHDPLNYLKSILFTGLKNLVMKETSFIGGYSNIFFNSKANLRSIEKRINSQYFRSKKEIFKLSEINLLYLNRIIDLCKKHKVELVFLNPPLEKSYRDKIPLFYINYYNWLIRNKNFSVIEFDHLNLDEKCFIPDGDHVSQYGSEICTKELESKIRSMKKISL
jgi:hypothetical protein